MELQILRNEQNAVPLSFLSDDEQYNQLLDVLTEIKILTGALMYSGAELLVQTEVLKRFLVSHPEVRLLTMNEIRHAFYLNNFGEYEKIYRHYNRELNAEFMGDVLLAYLSMKHRFKVRAGADIRALLYPKPKPTKVLLSDGDYYAMIQNDFEQYKLSGDYLIFNTKSKYLFLRKKGLIQLTSKASWERNYLLAIQLRANENLSNNVAQKERTFLYNKIFETNFIPRAEHRQLIAQTRRIIYFKFFDLLRNTAIHRIFEEVEF